MADLIVDSNIVASLRNRTNIREAISEFFDNAGDAKATAVAVRIGKDEVVVIDNGHGLRDLNLLFKPGASKSRLLSSGGGPIGLYGIGAKEATLHFGSLVIVDSVCEGKYRRYQIDWDEIERRGTPTPHDGRTLPISKAPPAIANGGTRIIIKRLSAGRPRIYHDVLIKQLSHRYRPGIRKGKSYLIEFANGEQQSLTADAEALGLWKNEREIMGMAADRPFTLRYTDLKEYDLNLTGIHIGFGDRFIQHIKKLDGKTLPPLFYAEVMLSSKWKDCLSANKTSLIRFSDELDSSLHALLKQWIQELETYFDEVRIEKLNLLLQRHTAQILVFKSGTGPYTKGKKVTVTEPCNGEGPVDADPHKEEHKAEPDEDGAGDKQERKRRPPGLRFKRTDTLGKVPFEIESDLKNSQITIHLNGTIPAIESAYRVPYKMAVLWPLISAAFAGWVRENIKGADDYLPGFLLALKIAGYDVDPERADQLELYIIDWMMRQCPPSVHKLEKTEDAA